MYLNWGKGQKGDLQLVIYCTFQTDILKTSHYGLGRRKGPQDIDPSAHYKLKGHDKYLLCDFPKKKLPKYSQGQKF